MQPLGSLAAAHVQTRAQDGFSGLTEIRATKARNTGKVRQYPPGVSTHTFSNQITSVAVPH